MRTVCSGTHKKLSVPPEQGEKFIEKASDRKGGLGVQMDSTRRMEAQGTEQPERPPPHPGHVHSLSFCWHRPEIMDPRHPHTCEKLSSTATFPGQAGAGAVN